MVLRGMAFKHLDVNNVCQVLQSAGVTAGSWLELASRLEPTLHAIDTGAINKTWIGDATQCLRAVIAQWIQKDSNCSWFRLAEAVKYCSGYGDVTATNIMKAAMTGSAAPTWQPPAQVQPQPTYTWIPSGSAAPTWQPPAQVQPQPTDTVMPSGSAAPTWQPPAQVQPQPTYTWIPSGSAAPTWQPPAQVQPQPTYTWIPSEHNMQFPYLDTRNMSEDAKKDLKMQLRGATSSMRNKYAKLVDQTCQSLEQHVPPLRLALYVKNLGVCNTEVFNKDTTVTEIFFVLANFWSFFNYSLLEEIIISFGQQEDKDSLQTYLNDFRFYCKRRVFEVPPDVYMQQGGCGKKFALKLDRKLHDCTLNSLIDVTAIVATVLNVRPSTLYLCRVVEGCVRLLYILPELVAEKVLPLSVEQELRLRHTLPDLNLDYLQPSDFITDTTLSVATTTESSASTDDISPLSTSTVSPHLTSLSEDVAALESFSVDSSPLIVSPVVDTSLSAAFAEHSVSSPNSVSPLSGPADSEVEHEHSDLMSATAQDYSANVPFDTLHGATIDTPAVLPSKSKHRDQINFLSEYDKDTVFEASLDIIHDFANQVHSSQLRSSSSSLVVGTQPLASPPKRSGDLCVSASIPQHQCLDHASTVSAREHLLPTKEGEVSDTLYFQPVSESQSVVAGEIPGTHFPPIVLQFSSP